jgi:hypothetical protein
MKKILSILAIGLFLAGCTERIDIELDSTYERLVVEGHITTDTTSHWVRLTRSAEYFGNEPIPFVSGAEVTLSDGNQTLVMEENRENPGYYETSPDYYGVVGKTYSISIQLPEEIGGSDTYEASCELRPIGEIDSIRVEYNESWEIYEVQIFAWEPPSRDFYTFQVLKNGVLLTDTIDEVFASDDRFYNGNYTNGILVGFLDPDNPEEVPEPGDTITLKMSGITEDYFNFLIQLQDQTFQFRNPLFSGPPANVITNIEGATGFFSASSVVYSSTVYDE